MPGHMIHLLLLSMGSYIWQYDIKSVCKYCWSYMQDGQHTFACTEVVNLDCFLYSQMLDK